MKTPSKTFLFFNFALAALIGFAAGMPIELKADDTEIYLGDASVSAGVRPNVLFVLDTSGSMSNKDGGSIDRLDRMKDALDKILTDVNNINVGLMRFTDPGGPILFPVSYIDEDVNVVESGGATAGTNVNVQIAATNDDAEESKADGSVNVLSPSLEFMTSTGGDETTIFRQVSSQANNAEQQVGNGDVITQNQIDMQSGQTNAVRFESIDIPPNAEIIDARIQFTGRNGDSSNTDLTFHGDANLNAPVFPTSCSGCADVSGRTKTTASVLWNPGDWSTDEAGPDTTTPSLKTIVQEIVGVPGGAKTGWVSGNPLVFVQTHGGSGRRRAHTFQGNAAKAATFAVTYTVKTAPSLQWVGLRFQNVGIPQGAKINSARIEFRPRTGNSKANPSAKIHGDATKYAAPKLLDAAPFRAVKDNITNRTKTSATVNWNNIQDWEDPKPAVPPAAPPAPKVYQTPDLTAIVQELVGDKDWCGNNAMGFMFEEAGSGDDDDDDDDDDDTPMRIGESFDGDPSRAPILRIDWDTTSAPNGCINLWTQRQVDSGADDAEETISSGSVSTGGSQLDMQSSQINGIRFEDVQIPQGATIHEAYITFTARDTDTGASTLRLWNQRHVNAPEFSTNNSDVSDRTKGVSVDWTPNDWDTVDEQHTTPDIKTLIQDVVSDTSWKGGNSLVVLQELISGSQRRAYTMNGSAAQAPVLNVKFEGQLTGGAGTGTKTVRTELKELIKGFNHSGHTPVVDTLYEAALYYKGEAPLYGAKRGHDRNGTYSPDPNASSTNEGVRRNTRLSHPASYTGGTVSYPGNCKDTDLNHKDCIDQKISGSPLYQSPITESCQASYIILLTDGYANHNHSEKLIKTKTGNAGACIEGDSRDDSCGRDITKWLSENDQGTGPSGDQYVTTYTIGFNFSSDWLKNVALDSGGSFYTADSSNELVNVFKAIIADILSRTTSFATPALSVNAFNKLFHRNDVYFSLFKPTGKEKWDGNVKKYELCKSAADGCDLGEVLDANGDTAVNAANAIRDEALSFWSGGTDGAEIKVGGAGNEIPTHASRRVYTYTGGGLPAKLDDTANVLTDGNAAVTKAFLGNSLMSDAERTDLINWIRGQDVDDEDGDTNKTENRFRFHDPLHSSPVAVTYGGTEAAPVIKLFVGTNDGGIRMTNAWHDPADPSAVKGGEEEWIFYPEEKVDMLRTLRQNANGDHLYGIDGTPTIWLNDEAPPGKIAGDGIIDPDYDGNSDGVSEFVRLFIGMRRGGDHYYALDVSPPGTDPISDPTLTDQIAPTLLWKIDGGLASGGTVFPRLGQTWSQPQIAKIAVGTTTAGESITKSVLIFGGGYDPDNDNKFATGGEYGNAIYIADPSDGGRVFWLSGTDHVASDGVHVPGMDWSIPADVALMDSDGDGTTDRLYVGDVGGNLWRVDLQPDLSTSAGIDATVGKLASVSDASDPLDQRKFFYKPDVVQVYGFNYASVQRYDLVTINTGNRAHPLDLSVQDRFYAFRDYHVTSLVDDGSSTGSTADDGLADSYGKCDAPTPPTLPTCTPLQGKTQALTGDLFDVTDVNDPQGSDLASLQAADGYFLDFEGSGEKGLASPVVLGGTAFFTSYMPEGVVSSSACSLAEGSGLLYAINVLNGASVYPNWDDVGDDTNLTKADRTYTLGGGIPSSAVPIFQEEGITLLIGGGGGATTIDPDLALPRNRTYWGQEE